jgi:hypothetical protein
MSPASIIIRSAVAALLCASLGACGKSGDEAGNMVSLKDLEVVDGTTSDAMTDLDGVKTEGTALAPVPSNATAPAPSSDRAASSQGNNEAAPPEEVISDQ